MLLRTDGNGWTRIDTWEKTTRELRRMPYALLAPEPDELLAGLRGGLMVLSDRRRYVVATPGAQAP